MFDDLAPEDVLAAVACADFGVVEPIDVTGVKRIDAIQALERSIRAAQAEIATQSVALLAERREAARGMHDPFLSVAAEVAMAWGMSPSSGVGFVNYATGLSLMPHVREAFSTGVVSEATARAIVRECDTLDPDTTGQVDVAIAPDLPGLTPRKAADLTRQLVVTMDLSAAAEREERERAEQHITHHPSADGVGCLVVRGPAEQMLGIHRSLQKHADTLRAKGDPRDRGQIMVNSLFERVTGQVVLDGPDVHLDILMPIDALQGQGVAASSPDTVRSAPTWRRSWSIRQRPPGTAGCSPTPPGRSSDSTRGNASSPAFWRSGSTPATTTGASRAAATAGRGTRTTSSHTPTAEPRRKRTVRHCAPCPTRSRSSPAGTSNAPPTAAPDGPRPPATSTTHHHHAPTRGPDEAVGSPTR